ncbi:SDR family oxidoreductase [Shewanella yunxiaonensis]|uniref:SDR family oxidoreductase n=1 Tax=Shewanella yunxiaonensis TaxID=2829809 RepID=A0ABX7YUQ3_9GAMM|nr:MULTISPECIES: SDR family oxidoreductase [Shewanella]MDF0534969.1 SDR family oxidoreductase [Shewanella sp. A32]QUN06218.1 SDR family oxidoreductase [Shewanella yunxiaonensis]
MTEIKQRSVLITGGASGIGLLMAQHFAKEGAAKVVLWDINAKALQQAMSSLRHHFGQERICGWQVDISQSAQMREALQQMHVAGITIDILVNNAGIIVGKQFTDYSDAEIERTMAVNAIAPMQLCRALLPQMRTAGSGHIVNIASAAALVSNPGMSVYCASKWAAVGWSDSLRLEMMQQHTGIKVTTVMPYYINTGMFAGVQSRLLPILKPDKVAKRIVKAIQRDKIILKMPRLLYLLPLLQGLLPQRWFDKVVGDWLGIYHTMDTFRGRQP